MAMRLRRLLGLLALVVLVGQVSGLADFLIADDCARRCAKQDADHQPDPACDVCPCCAPTRLVVITAPPATADRAPGRSLIVERAQAPVDPEPSEIPHIPKPVA